MSADRKIDPNSPIPLDAEFCKQAAQLMRRSVSFKLQPGEQLHIEGELAHGHAIVVCVLESGDGSARARLECCVRSEPNAIDNPLDARGVALDFCHAIVKQYLAEERFMVLSSTWQEHDFRGKAVLLRGNRCNPLLESEAERLLAEHGFGPHGEAIDSQDEA